MDISLSSSCTASKLSSAEELINVEAQSRMTHSKNWLGLSKLGPGQNYWQLWSSINSRIRGRQSAPPPIKRSIPEFHQGPAHERSWAKVEIECAPTKHKKDRSRNILRGKGNAEDVGWGTKVYVQKQSGPSNGILHRFCLTKGSTLTSQDYNPSSVVYVSKPTRAIWRYLLSEFRALLCCSLSQLNQPGAFNRGAQDCRDCQTAGTVQSLPAGIGSPACPPFTLATADQGAPARWRLYYDCSVCT